LSGSSQFVQTAPVPKKQVDEYTPAERQYLVNAGFVAGLAMPAEGKREYLRKMRKLANVQVPRKEDWGEIGIFRSVTSSVLLPLLGGMALSKPQ
jgi:hypothetical protein